ncbi:MAG: S8 family serine peptidase [Nitrospiraceae bacterium]
MMNPTIRVLTTLALGWALCLNLSGCSAGESTTPTTSTPTGSGGVTGGGPVAVVDDPLFSQQWHLENTGQDGGTAGEDARVVGVWNQDIGGRGVRIAVVDDGLEIGHEDLVPNVIPGQSHNYLTNGSDPTPISTGTCREAGGSADCHGTAVAGVAAAFANKVGGRGVSPQANLVGYNLLASGVISPDSLEADAMTRNAVTVWVSNNSWGAPDDGRLHPSGPLWKTGVLSGLSGGRNGLGTIYVWAGGNGGPRRGDNSNYEGYANFRGVIAVCAVNAAGRQPPYSDPGANLWVCAPSNTVGPGFPLPGITTTDRSGSQGYNTGGSSGEAVNAGYTTQFGGTSAATAVVSGVAALILQANPNLGWRDVRWVLAETARQNDAGDADWTLNGAGFHVNHKYGFGTVDAETAVTRARTWTNLGPQRTFSRTLAPSLALADAGTTTNTVAISASGISRIEWIEIEVTLSHPNDGELEIVLRNETTGTTSVLAEPRTCAGSGIDLCGNYDGWIFGSARHLGEGTDGNWTLQIRDASSGLTGTLTSWKLTFYGT